MFEKYIFYYVTWLSMILRYFFFFFLYNKYVSNGYFHYFQIKINSKIKFLLFIL